MKVIKVIVLSLFIVLSFFITKCKEGEGQKIEQVDITKNNLSNITIIGVEGKRTGMHTVTLPETFKADGVLRVQWKMRDQSGAEKLLDNFTSENSAITVPSFVMPKSNSVFTIDAYINDALYGGIDVYSTQQLPTIPTEMQDSILEQTDTSYLMDMKKIEKTTSQGIWGQILTPSESTSNSGIAVTRLALGNCGGGINGPGVGRFLSTSPGPWGQKFSFCPEEGPALNWAIQGDLAVDAIYNQYWGCTVALKVPNNCTVTVASNSSMSYCCGFPYYPVSPSWINPSSDPYFPDCPLTY